jgi:AcrR family transcriptional regulator
MTTPTPTPEQPALSTKEALLVAAKKVFATKGYAGATVKEVADEAGVNVSLVSYHYNGKENLFRACLEAHGLRRLAATEQFLKEPQSAEDFRVRLTLFLEDFYESTLEDPDTSIIMQRECLHANNELVQDLLEGVFMKGIRKIIDFFESAKKKGLIRPDLDPHYIVLAFTGAMFHAVQMNQRHEEFFKTGIKDEAHREKIVQTIIQLVMGGIQP